MFYFGKEPGNTHAVQVPESLNCPSGQVEPPLATHCCGLLELGLNPVVQVVQAPDPWEQLVHPSAQAWHWPFPESKKPFAQTEHCVELEEVLVVQPALHVHALVAPVWSQVPNAQLQEDGGNGVIAERQAPVPEVPSSHFEHPVGHSATSREYQYQIYGCVQE